MKVNWCTNMRVSHAKSSKQWGPLFWSQKVTWHECCWKSAYPFFFHKTQLVHTLVKVSLSLAFEDFLKEATSRKQKREWVIIQNTTHYDSRMQKRPTAPLHTDQDTCDNNSPLKTSSESRHIAAFPAPAEGFTTYYYHGLPPSTRMIRPLTHCIA